jgi:hypothetical protein
VLLSFSSAHSQKISLNYLSKMTNQNLNCCQKNPSNKPQQLSATSNSSPCTDPANSTYTLNQTMAQSIISKKKSTKKPILTCSEKIISQISGPIVMPCTFRPKELHS